MEGGDPLAQVIGGGGRVQKKLIRVQLSLVDFDHGPSFFQGRGDVLRVPALDSVVTVSDGILVFLEGPRLYGIHGRRSLLAAHRGQQLPCAVFRHLGGKLFNLCLGFLQLAGCQFLRYGL